jgi:stage III sporulation protein SpoIIIAA
LKSVLNLGEVNVQSIGDFGFGKGILLREIAKEFNPKRIMAIDPSKEANDNLQKQKWIKTSQEQYTLSIGEPKCQMPMACIRLHKAWLTKVMILMK